jgi:hypothetical protein
MEGVFRLSLRASSASRHIPVAQFDLKSLNIIDLSRLSSQMCPARASGKREARRLPLVAIHCLWFDN